MLAITQEIQGSTTVLNISGRLEFSGRKVFMGAMTEVQQVSLTHLILNLKLKNVRVSIVNAQEYVKKVLDLANFSKIISSFPTVQDAMRAPVHA